MIQYSLIIYFILTVVCAKTFASNSCHNVFSETNPIRISDSSLREIAKLQLFVQSSNPNNRPQLLEKLKDELHHLSELIDKDSTLATRYKIILSSEFSEFNKKNQEKNTLRRVRSSKVKSQEKQLRLGLDLIHSEKFNSESHFSPVVLSLDGKKVIYREVTLTRPAQTNVGFYDTQNSTKNFEFSNFVIDQQNIAILNKKNTFIVINSESGTTQNNEAMIEIRSLNNNKIMSTNRLAELDILNFSISEIKVSPNEDFFAILASAKGGDTEEYLLVYNTTNYSLEHKIKLKNWVHNIQWTPDNSKILVLDQDSKNKQAQTTVIDIQNKNEFQIQRAFLGYKKDFVSKDGQYFVFSNSHSDLNIMDLKSKNIIYTGKISGFIFGRDISNYTFATLDMSTLSLHDFKTGNVISQFKLNVDGEINDVIYDSIQSIFYVLTNVRVLEYHLYELNSEAQTNFKIKTSQVGKRGQSIDMQVSNDLNIITLSDLGALEIYKRITAKDLDNE